MNKEALTAPALEALLQAPSWQFLPWTNKMRDPVEPIRLTDVWLD